MKKWILMSLAATAASPAFAADFSMRSECARVSARYIESRQIDAVSAMHLGRQGDDTVYVRLGGTGDFHSFATRYNPQILNLVNRAYDTQQRVNLCVDGNGYMLGIEMDHD
jgi:opacity protein-like surface antigen